MYANLDFIAVLEAHAQAISAAMNEADPGAADYKNEVSASAGKWENLNLLAFMKARGEEVVKQIGALYAGNFPRLDDEVPEMESCQDWRSETPPSGAYEQGASCNPPPQSCHARLERVVSTTTTGVTRRPGSSRTL